MRAVTAMLPAMLLALAACTDSAPAPVEVSDPEVGASSSEDEGKGIRTYRITLRNLTSGQPLSPGVAATHTKAVSVWRVGSQASEGIRLIAENGEEAVAVSTLRSMPGVFDVVDISVPTNRVGGTAPLPNPQSFEIRARGNANRLSLAVMLICTNDGFTGVSEVKLPGGFRPEEHAVGAYDAGTEQNNERFNQIVDPCGAIGPVSHPADGNGRVATIQLIRPHANIQGVGDLSVSQHGWQFPVARITVRRVR